MSAVQDKSLPIHSIKGELIIRKHEIKYVLWGCTHLDKQHEPCYTKTDASVQSLTPMMETWVQFPDGQCQNEKRLFNILPQAVQHPPTEISESTFTTLSKKNHRMNQKSFQTPILYTRVSSSLYHSMTIILVEPESLSFWTCGLYFVQYLTCFCMTWFTLTAGH